MSRRTVVRKSTLKTFRPPGESVETEPPKICADIPPVSPTNKQKAALIRPSSPQYDINEAMHRLRISSSSTPAPEPAPEQCGQEAIEQPDHELLDSVYDDDNHVGVPALCLALER